MENKFSKVRASDFDAVIDGVKVSLFTLKNKSGLEISATNYGGRIVEIFAPDRRGEFADIALGKDTLDAYANGKTERFLGCVVGRYANRIADAKFVLNGVEYRLAANNGKNSLHGGVNAFDKKPWRVLSADSSHLRMALVSPDGDEGFPARVEVEMLYTLTDAGELVIEYTAVSGGDTHVNLTNHSFFNLHGAGVGDINDHIMTINADKFTPIDDGLIPEGAPVSVDGTPFDFRKPTVIGARVDGGDIQLKRAGGYDHNWVLNKTSEGALDFAAEVYEPVSGRVLTVYTTQPGMQFYGGNFFAGNICKGGKAYGRRCGLALETQHFPDTPNRPDFPPTLLRKGETYRHVCKYAFSVR